MSKYKLLLAGISLIAAQQVVASEIKEELIDANKVTVSSGKITNVFKAEESKLKQYDPKATKCETFKALLDQPTIKIGERSYEFVGGFEYYKKTPAVKNAVKDVILTDCFLNDVDLVDVAVMIPKRSLLLTYQYAYGRVSSYAYSFTVKTALDEKDFEEAQLQIILNKYIPAQAGRDAFQNLKTEGMFCTIPGYDRQIGFVSGKEIFADHEQRLKTPLETFPSDLWGNSYRANHQLVKVDPDLKNGGALISYKYVPSQWYYSFGGKGTHFGFTVATPLDTNDFLASKLIKIEDMAQKLYSDILKAHQQEFITAEDFANLILGTSDARINCKEKMLMEDMSMANISKQFDFWQSKLDFATSPLNLMFDGKTNTPKIFELAREYKPLNIATDSINTFAAASLR